MRGDWSHRDDSVDVCEVGGLLGQFSHLSFVDLLPFGQLGGEKLGHDVLEQNCGVVLPVFKELPRGT